MLSLCGIDLGKQLDSSLNIHVTGTGRRNWSTDLHKPFSMWGCSRRHFQKHSATVNACDVWEELKERFDEINGSRTFSLHKDIATLTQGTMYVSMYFNRLKGLWNEFEALVPSPDCNYEKSRDFVIYLQRLKLYQFLMGLNESYTQPRSQIRSQILRPSNAMNTMGHFYQTGVYTRASSSQNVNHFEPSALYLRNGNQTRNQKYKKDYNLWCDVSKMKGHIRESCYKIVGYPPSFKKIKYSIGNGQGNSAAYNASLVGHHSAQNQGSTNQGIENHIISNVTGLYQGLLDQNKMTQLTNMNQPRARSDDISSNTTGKFVGLNNECLDKIVQWIIDIGETNHMVSTINMLNKSSITKTKNPKLVYLPNRDISVVTRTGSSSISSRSTLENVFLLPQFKYNLMSVSKDLSSGKVKEIGRQEDGSYLLNQSPGDYSNDVVLVAKINQDIFLSEINLWHMRFGHLSSSVLYKLLSSTKDSIAEKDNTRTVCPCAKQTRLPYPLNKTVKICRTDNGAEFVNELCDTMFKNACIIYQRTYAYSPQQNGVAERKHIHILEVRRALILIAHFPFKILGILCASCCLHNQRMLSSVIGVSPYEKLHKRKPSLNHFRVLGCLCHAKIVQQIDKLLARTKTVVFMGYLEVQKGYILYDLITKSFFVNRDIAFKETVFPFKESTADTPIFQQFDVLCYDEPEYAVTTNHSVELSDVDTESKNYKEAIKDPRWVEALQAEIVALPSNNTWEIVSLPEGKTPIGYKWIYKIKYKASREVERFKARLVAKGYIQQEGIDYQENFSPIDKMGTARTILSIVATKQWDTHQIDVYNAFLQGDLYDEIYMDLPQGIAPRQWNAKLTEALVRLQFVQSQHDHSLFVRKTKEL
ncbi:uncharacterized protein LOC132048692 [Lycium ferocissimum]|uniref:uncharacterized protein LOC132048692 n=1 Tax=Lycium ferocissimum TaxID=112874 RepID=UPI002814FA1B|nr:uncharacterized protein LOC132048692 [Lycium ferocissimum]